MSCTDKWDLAFESQGISGTPVMLRIRTRPDLRFLIRKLRAQESIRARAWIASFKTDPSAKAGCFRFLTFTQSQVLGR